MSNVAIRVSDAVDEFLSSSRSRGDRTNTLKTKRGTLDKLLILTGNIYLKNVTSAHIDELFGEMQSNGLRPSTINLHRSNLITFFKWCQTRRYIAAMVSPMGGVRPLKVMPREMLRVPAAKFAHLLDCAEHPRDRMMLSLALYLFLRQSEIKQLRVGDVNLDDGFVSVTIYKTGQRDDMPISKPLERELRRWLTWYASHVDAPLDKSWYLLPVRSRPKFTGVKGGGFSRVNDYDTLDPTRYLRRLEGVAQAALERAGYPIRDLDDSSNHVGMHTLRRSGARARYDYRIDGGHDGAIREVQAMLHHASQTMTETYLGITLDIKRRNESIRGHEMFADDDAATVTLISDRQQVI